MPARRDILSPDFWLAFWRELTGNALHATIQIAGVLVAYLFVRAALFRLIDGILGRLLAHERRAGAPAERAGRLQTLQGLCKSVVGYLLFFIFGVLFLKAVGFDIMPFVETAGVIGLAVGFGAQKLVKDVISGFFIILDNQFVVGDTITIGAVTGQVQEMGMRVTRLRDAGGRTVIYPNGDIGMVTNLSRGPVEDFVEVSLAATADLAHATQVIEAEGTRLMQSDSARLRAAPRVLGLSAFSAAATTVRVSVVTDPNNLTAVQMEVRAAVRRALMEAQIPLA